MRAQWVYDNTHRKPGNSKSVLQPPKRYVQFLIIERRRRSILASEAKQDYATRHKLGSKAGSGISSSPLSSRFQ